MTFFVVCFGIGITFLILAAVLGGVLDTFNINIGHFGEMAGGGHISPLSPTFLSFFLTVFGAAGGASLELLNLSFRWSILVALILSLGLATLVYLGLVKVFAKTQGGVDVNVAELGGREAEVLTSIPAGGAGEIAFITSGGRVNGPARSEDGGPIKHYTTVEIVKVVGNTYIVRSKGVASAPPSEASAVQTPPVEKT